MLTFNLLIEDTGDFANSDFFWNIVFDESCLSRWNWRQNSLLTAERKTETATYNPEFYSMKDFSATVVPGAHRIAVNCDHSKRPSRFRTPTAAACHSLQTTPTT